MQASSPAPPVGISRSVHSVVRSLSPAASAPLWRQGMIQAIRLLIIGQQLFHDNLSTPVIPLLWPHKQLYYWRENPDYIRDLIASLASIALLSMACSARNWLCKSMMSSE
jgi:hypothetical protein